MCAMRRLSLRVAAISLPPALSQQAAHPQVLTISQQLVRFKSRVNDWGTGSKCGERCELDEQGQHHRLANWMSASPVDGEQYRSERTRRHLPAPIPPKPTKAGHQGPVSSGPPNLSPRGVSDVIK